MRTSRRPTVERLKRVAKGSLCAAMLTLVAACVVETREGYWDRDHHRWYGDHTWHECGENDMHCR